MAPVVQWTHTSTPRRILHHRLIEQMGHARVNDSLQAFRIAAR
jgi:hypothetical protein